MYIYGLKHPNSLEPRYVGFTSKTLEKRLTGHIWEANSHSATPTHKNRWIKSLTKHGIKPEVFVIEEVSEDNWKAREQFWIKTLKEKGYRLTNATDGGDGILGFKPTKRTLEYLSKVRKGKSGYWKGKHHSEATKQKISQSKQNPSLETRRKIGKSNKLKKNFKEHMQTITELARTVNMQKKRKLTDEQIEEIKLLSSQGLSAYQIAPKFNVSAVTIYNTLKNKLKYQS